MPSNRYAATRRTSPWSATRSAVRADGHRAGAVAGVPVPGRGPWQRGRLAARPGRARAAGAAAADRARRAGQPTGLRLRGAAPGLRRGEPRGGQRRRVRDLGRGPALPRRAAGGGRRPGHGGGHPAVRRRPLHPAGHRRGAGRDDRPAAGGRAVTERTLDAFDLGGSLARAQRELLAAASAGRAADQVWLLPAGVHPIAGTLDLGAPGVSLTLRGQRTSLGVVPAPGTAGQAAALTLRGRAVVLEAVTVTCGPVTADLVGVRLEGSERAAAREVWVDGVHAGAGTGVQVTAPRVELAGVRVANVVATTGIATGVQVTAADGPGVEGDGIVVAERVDVRGVRGPQVRGVAVEAATGTVTDVAVAGLASTVADGVEQALLVPDSVAVARIAIERSAPVGDGAQLVGWLQAA